MMFVADKLMIMVLITTGFTRIWPFTLKLWAMTAISSCTGTIDIALVHASFLLAVAGMIPLPWLLLWLV